MSDSWHTYPQIFALGHRYVRDLLLDPVVVEEKIDGSQFSFGVFEDGLRIRSKGAMINPDCCPKLFARAVETVLALRDKLHVGWTYRGEALDKPKHNVLAYNRVPSGNVILFDVNDGEESYLDPAAKAAEAARLGLETVALLHIGDGAAVSEAWIKDCLQRESCLGGPKIEGVVIKNYARFGIDKKALMGKYVSEAFKEKHAGAAYGKQSFGSVIERIVAALKTDARWQKAAQHLRDSGLLTESPKDIGPLIREIHADLQKEETEFIKDALFKEFWKDIAGGVIRGVPEWWKERLLAAQFNGETPLETTELAQAEPETSKEEACQS